jgi:hypothetical protein
MPNLPLCDLCAHQSSWMRGGLITKAHAEFAPAYSSYLNAAWLHVHTCCCNNHRKRNIHYLGRTGTQDKNVRLRLCLDFVMVCDANYDMYSLHRMSVCRCESCGVSLPAAREVRSRFYYNTDDRRVVHSRNRRLVARQTQHRS